MQEFLHLYFQGGRYDSLQGVPFEALKSIGDIQSLVRSVARDLFFDGNPTRKKVPAGFDDAFRPAITKVEGGGSADLSVSWQSDSLSVHAPLYDEARSEIVGLLERFRAEPPGLPEWVSRESIGLLAGVLGAVEEAESVKVTAAEDESVIVGFAERSRVEAEAGRALDAKDEPYHLVGHLHRVDDAPHHVAIHLHEGRRDQNVPIAPALKGPCLDALRLNAETLVRLTGTATRTDEGRAFGDATAVQIIGGPPVAPRLDELRRLQAGWLLDAETEGASAAPDHILLTLIGRHIWRIIELAGVDRPHIFAVPDGGLELAWRRADIRATARFSPTSADIAACAVSVSTRTADRAELRSVTELARWLSRALGDVS